MTGMCSEVERTDSFFVTSKHIAKTDRIENVKNDTLYIGNCTRQLLTGLRTNFQKNRREQGKISFKNNVESLWNKGILQMLSCVCTEALFVCQPIEHSKVAILNYIHKQDGEK